MASLDVPKGDDVVSPPPESPQTLENKQNQDRKKHLGAGIAFCGVILIALLVGLVPDWNKETQSPKEEEKAFFKAFDPNLPFFNENITNGYQDQADLENDLAQFAFMTLNQSIKGIGVEGGWYGGGCGYGFWKGNGFLEDTVMDSAPSVGKPGGGATNIFDNVNSFETNNQEEGIDTADQAKSDGTFLYSAYGDTLLVLTAENGELKTEVKMPPINTISAKPEDPPGSSTQGGSSGINGGQSSSTPGAGAGTNTSSSVARSIPPPYFSNPTPQIEALLLEGDKLTLIASGYGAEYAVNATESSVLCGYFETRIIVYDTNGGDPRFISQKDVHGSFRQAYSLLTNGKKVGHVVTRASIDTWTHLSEPIQRHHFPKNLTDDQYHEEAVKKAQTLVPKFVEKLSQVLSGIDLTRLSLFADNIKDEDTLDGIMSQLRVADTMSIVSSFEMEDSSYTDLAVSLGGALQPGFWGYVYANRQMIVLADKGWSYVDDVDEYVETTYLVGFRLDGASTKHEVVGSTRGSPLNPYSIDLVEKGNMLYVRMATTMNFWRNSVAVDEGDEPELVDATSDSSATINTTESRTHNEIIMLGTEKSGSLLKKQSSVKLGKPNERFTAVRFLDDIAYAVTFLRRDPFYAVDLSNPADIKVLGELDVSGFSEYLHPIKGGKILAVGQETEDDGTILGLQISLFGASDPKNLTLINRLVVENDKNTWSSSGVSWEPKAFRFFTVADMGILIIPLNINSYGRWEGGQWQEPSKEENFQGFVTFTIENANITRRFDIDHLDFSDITNDNCGWCGSLPERSFVINGNVLTLKSQTIVSTDLGTAKADWFLDVRKNSCCA